MATRAYKSGCITSTERLFAKTLSWATTEDERCRKLSNLPRKIRFVQTVLMDESIFRIGVSVFIEHAKSSKGNRTYIAGLEFISRKREQPNKIFGYRIPGKQIYADFESWKDVRGFEFAMSKKGIHAMRICHARVSHWLGSQKAQDVKQTRHVPDRDIAGLWGNFDVSGTLYLTVTWTLPIHFH